MLAATVGLSAVLSAAAAGFILVSGQVRGGDMDALNRARLYYGGEAGLLMGARHVMKTWEKGTMEAATFTSQHAVTGPTKEVDSILVSVLLLKDMATNALSIECRATHSYPSDTLKLTWAIKSVNLPQTGDGLKSRLEMEDLRDTVILRR